jgi:hypothetical protein
MAMAKMAGKDITDLVTEDITWPLGPPKKEKSSLRVLKTIVIVRVQKECGRAMVLLCKKLQKRSIFNTPLLHHCS